MNQPIAILDSGVGGLTVAKEVMRQLPKEKVIYFGDTARAPYGPRHPEQIKEFTGQIVDYLLQFEPKMVVIACNTATAIALEDIRARIDVPVVGVIHPGARAAIKSTRSGSVGVIGTEGTINSGAYEAALRSYSPSLEVMSLACPRLVPLVERGQFHEQATVEAVAESLAPLRDEPIDCLILGCTHYPFLQDEIAQVMGPQVKLINSAEETAREVSTLLYHRGKLSQRTDPPTHQFFCSGDPGLFKSITLHLLGEELQVKPVMWQVKQIS